MDINEQPVPWSTLVAWTVGMLVAACVFGGMVLFGTNSSCTDRYSCTVSTCAPCEPLTLAFYVHLVTQAVVGAAVVVAAYVRRARRRPGDVVAAGLVIAVAVAVVYAWWSSRWASAGS